MNILTISGSSVHKSSNTKLLESLAHIAPQNSYTRCGELYTLPLYRDDSYPIIPESVMRYRDQVKAADAIIISTPEYIYNIPAVLKNALEWVTTSGEMRHKKVLALTYMPNPPRGQKAMQSLTSSLQALEVDVVATLALYHIDIDVTQDTPIIRNEENYQVLQEAISLLANT